MPNTDRVLKRLFASALLALGLAGCAGHGAEGVSVPPPTDFSHFDRPTAPHTALAAPAGYAPRSGPVPDIALPTYPVPAGRLFAAIRQVAAAQPRTYPLVTHEDSLQADWVVRSASMNFPDLVIAQVSPVGKDASTLILYSTSLYGYYDFGVNRARLEHWAAALGPVLNTK